MIDGMKKVGNSNCICVRGRLMDMSRPRVMGILNVTPDSFFAGSRVQTEESIADRAQQMVTEGADIIDVGACSTRPGSEPVEEQEELRRLELALKTVRREVPDAVVSVDTFRPQVALRCVEEWGADIINDVGHGEEMFRMAARLRVPYILMSTEGDLLSMLKTWAREVEKLRALGVADIILDPGFGFGKSLEQNHRLMGQLEDMQIMGLPLLVGISRKSMISKVLNRPAEECLNGTTVLNTMALMQGASILRVHDVRPAVEAVKLLLCNKQ